MNILDFFLNIYLFLIQIIKICTLFDHDSIVTELQKIFRILVL